MRTVDIQETLLWGVYLLGWTACSQLAGILACAGFLHTLREPVRLLCFLWSRAGLACQKMLSLYCHQAASSCSLALASQFKKLTFFLHSFSLSLSPSQLLQQNQMGIFSSKNIVEHFPPPYYRPQIHVKNQTALKNKRIERTQGK